MPDISHGCSFKQLEIRATCTGTGDRAKKAFEPCFCFHGTDFNVNFCKFEFGLTQLPEKSTACRQNTSHCHMDMVGESGFVGGARFDRPTCRAAYQALVSYLQLGVRFCRSCGDRSHYRTGSTLQVACCCGGQGFRRVAKRHAEVFGNRAGGSNAIGMAPFIPCVERFKVD